MSLTIGRYRKKPVVVEAVEFTEALASEVDLGQAERTSVEEWSRGTIRNLQLDPKERTLRLKGAGGEQDARVGDWIVKGADVEGEADFYPVRAEVFAKNYSPDAETEPEETVEVK